MGVPKFFRYISERYPCLSEILKEYQIPEFDNLYLDMNGIIHGCSHPNDSHVSFRITEEAILQNIFHYVEILFQMIQPQKLFFLAIDGVAPRAKINQQRSRRFRSAKEADDQEKAAREMGKDIPEEKKFDSNCITPGTLFMSKLNEQLRYFITKKISTNKSWQRCKVIFSGSEVPGEGEHKIMDYIRYIKSQPDYDINTRHCLYGLDADLIMLGLCTHEIHFTLLREEVKFGRKQKKIQTPEETKFCLLHLSLLREYINHEFLSLKDKLPFPYDLEKIIDDWVLMGFLIGNDFIPHLPNLHVINGALPILYHVYIDVLPTLEGYINEAGTLRLDRFEKFMERLSRLDVEQFSEQYADLKYFESKTGRRLNGTEGQTNKTKNLQNENITLEEQYNLFTSSMMTLVQELFEDPDDEESDSETYIMEFAQHKRHYYMNKLENENVDKEFLRSQAEGYVRAIQWNLHYYYNGCCSWSWYYPHHYAPYISDIKDFKDLKLEFELGQPFKPFEQLLSVLPPLSKDLLPPAFQPLLYEEDSPIKNYYPNNFKTDLNGKQQEWEAVVLLPFIDAKTLIDAMRPHYGQVTEEEQKRNQHGPMSVYSYTTDNMGICKAPEYFPDVISHAKVELISRDDIMIPREELVKGLCPGVKYDVYYPRFPTLQYIPHTSSLEAAKVKVFEQPSRGDNMILNITAQETPSLKNVAAELLGKIVFVNWPHMTEAIVQSIVDCKTKVELIDPEKEYSESNINEEVLNDSMVTQWSAQCKQITEIHKTRFGISIGDISVLVYARTMTGCKYMFSDHGRLYLEKQWSKLAAPFPFQTIVKDIATYCSDPELYKTVDEIFVPETVCFMLGHPYYGAKGKVLEPDCKSGRIKVVISTSPEPTLGTIKVTHARNKNLYMRANIAAQRLGISGYLLSKITGTLYVMRDSADEHRGNAKFNIGLNLKFNKKNEEAPGYTRKDNGQWLYSMKAVELVRDYMAKFPKIFERLEPFPLIILEGQLFDEKPDELNDTVAWLKEKLRDIESCPCGTDISDQQTVNKIEEEVDRFLEAKTDAEKHVVMRVKPNLLFKPGLQLRTIPVEDRRQNQMFDRICYISEYFTVPLGHKGFIIGIHRSQNAFDTMYDVLFDTPFSGGLSIRGCSEGRGYRLSGSHFLNISHAERLEHGRGITDAGAESNSWRGNNIASQPQSCNNQLQTSAFASFRRPDRPTTTDSNTQSPKKGTVKNWRKPQQIVSPQNIPTASSKPASEFQALWNELHEKQKLLVPPKPSMLDGIPVKEVNQHIGPNACQDPSVLLKAMLKISDCNTQPSTSTNNLQKPPSKVASQAESSSNPPPLVQQLFDHARQTGKAKEEKPPNWHFIQLRNRYQYNGLSMPQCNYFRDGETNLVRAHIVLPDARVFVGEPCKSYEQAAESAAKKAYIELNLVNLRPDLQALIPPSQQWFHSGMVDKMWMSIRPPMLPMFSTKNQPQPPFPIWKGQHNPVYQQGMQPPNQMQAKPKHQQKYQQQKRPTNELKSEVKNSTSFVPLQAQKKSRNVTPKQSTNDTNKRAKDNPPSNATQQINKTESSTKQTSQSETATTASAQSPAQSSSQQQQKTQKAAKPKRSRVAAKFGVPPTQEGKREAYST